METFQFYFELIGAAAFAISGAALGIRKEMDLFGVAMLTERVDMLQTFRNVPNISYEAIVSMLS